MIRIKRLGGLIKGNNGHYHKRGEMILSITLTICREHANLPVIARSPVISRFKALLKKLWDGVPSKKLHLRTFMVRRTNHKPNFVPLSV